MATPGVIFSPEEKILFELKTQASAYLSIREVSEILKIDYSTARRWLADGRLPGEKVANKIFGIRKDIEKIAESLEGTLTVEEVATRIGKATRTVNHLITATKELTAIKWMRRWYVTVESVDAYEEKNAK